MKSREIATVTPWNRGRRWLWLMVPLAVGTISACDAERGLGSDRPSSASACTSPSAECPLLPAAPSDRLALTSAGGCPGSDVPFYDQIEQALFVQSSDVVSLTTNVEICAAEQRFGESGVTIYDVRTRDQPISGVLFAGRKAPTETGPAAELWLFAFIDDRDVTRDLFGDANLVQMGDNGSAVAVPFTVPSDLDFHGGLLTFVLTDRYFTLDERAGNNFAYHRVVVNEENQAASPPPIQPVASDDSVRDPFPQTLVLEDTDGDPTSNAHRLTFPRGLETVDNPTTELTFFPFDASAGRRTALECGGGDTGGWIVASTRPGRPVSMICTFDEDNPPESTAAFIMYDQFVIAPDTGELYVSVFPEKALTYIGR